jgi:hypothetical protein
MKYSTRDETWFIVCEPTNRRGEEPERSESLGWGFMHIKLPAA